MGGSALAPGTAAARVRPYLATQFTALLTADDRLREGDESVVHAGRVAARRARSIVRVFGPLFEAPVSAHQDRELRWWAGTLGPVRDLQILQDRLDALVAGLDEELVVGPVRTRIDVELGHDRLQHWAAVATALTSERHGELVHHLELWSTEPPWTAKASRADSTLVPMLRRADRTVARRLRHAHRSDDVDAMHRARKAAKRARYAAEVLSTGESTRAKKNARRYQRLQDLLGEHQDSVVSAQLLRRLADVADHAPGESSFTFGLLHEAEQRRARETELEAQRLARRLFA